MGVTISQFFLPLAGCAALVLLFLTAALLPYKANAHNRINIISDRLSLHCSSSDGKVCSVV